MLGRAPGQPARRHPEPQPFPVMAGARHGILAYSYTAGFVSWEKVAFHVGAEARDTSLTCHWSKNETGGWKSVAGHPFLSRSRLPVSYVVLSLELRMAQAWSSPLQVPSLTNVRKPCSPAAPGLSALPGNASLALEKLGTLVTIKKVPLSLSPQSASSQQVTLPSAS